MRRNYKKGFTIVELVIVIAVIGVLSAILIPVFVNLTMKANIASDDSLIKNLNTALKMQEQEVDDKKNETLQDAIDDLIKEGFILENLVSKSGKYLLWNQDKNEFVLNKENTYSGAKYWQTVDKLPEYSNQKYSYYASKEFDRILVDLKYGFDVGYNDGLTGIYYIGNDEEAQSVSFRTKGGTLTINSSTDDVKHFGSSAPTTLNIISAKSYFEYGSVNQINIKNGKLIFTNAKEAKVNSVYLLKTDDNYNNIVLASQRNATMPSFIGRESISNPTSGKKLVTSIHINVNDEGLLPQNIESINLYPSGDVKEENNGYDVSSLGLMTVEAISTDGIEEASVDIDNLQILEQVKATKADCIAAVDSIGFTSFADAFDACVDKTVMFLKDIEANALNVYQTKSINLNGHTLTLNGHPDAGTTGGAIFIYGGGEFGHGVLSILNGKLDMNGTNFSIFGIISYGSLYLSNLTIYSACKAVVYVIGQEDGTAGTTYLDNVSITSTNELGKAFMAYSTKNSDNIIKPVITIKNSFINSNYDGVIINAADTTIDNTSITGINNVLWIVDSSIASGVTGTLTVQGHTSLYGGTDLTRLHKEGSNVINVVVGSYNFNPTSYVNSTIYGVIANGNVWTVSTK